MDVAKHSSYSDMKQFYIMTFLSFSYDQLTVFIDIQAEQSLTT